MSSEEEDYMSDTFLQQCQNLRPGLIPKQKIQQENERKKESVSKKVIPIPKRKLESHHRETGLNTEISSSSKGFLLLQKMGYKPGTGIGKSGGGRTEPIRIEVKTGREGLGSETEKKRKSLEINANRSAMVAKRQKYSEHQTKSFLARMKDKFAEKSLEKDLQTAQATCLQLDQHQGIANPDLPFFWPYHSLPTSTNDENDSDSDECISESPSHISTEPTLEKCRNRNESDSELEDNDTNDLSTQNDLPVSDRLEILTIYLRDTYKYCIWCGTAYDDKMELKSQCPGNSADSHD